MKNFRRNIEEEETKCDSKDYLARIT